MAARLFITFVVMISLSHKAKQYLLVALKVFILVGTLYYIYIKLNSTSISVRDTLSTTFNFETKLVVYYCLLFCFLVISNWLFEILKWKTLVASIKKISLFRATKESLAALTVSLATPNRIGEYGAKALFYSSQYRKKILLLNFIGNGFQMLTTMLFGAFGITYLAVFYNVAVSWISLVLFLIITLLLIFVGYLFKERELLVKGFTIAKVVTFYKRLPFWIKLKTILFSVIRYVIFSGMFFTVLHFFGVQVSPIKGFAAIFGMYLVSSILPSLLFLDVAVKGGIAVFLFSLIGVPEIPVLCTVLIMWLLNMVLPALLGSIFLFSLKQQTA